ncbi:tRNA pseudouridine(55) synthase TruB [bacterium]|nr:MAG: tRNA pseudouridine(55) synthase TruB [bacterium]
MLSDGLILSVNKPSAWTSFDVVAKLRRALEWKKVGHAGTLDPMATGVLILLFGAATRRSDEFMDLPKEYRTTIRFGLVTATDDTTGELLERREIDKWSESRIHEALQSFIGRIAQIPPAVSAVKVGGRRSYKAAFAGEALDLKARPVEIYGIDVHRFSKPDVELTIRCGRGTYIRSIARDLGNALGWGAVLAQLTRMAIGPYRIENSLPVETILKHKSEFTFAA